MQKVHVIGGGLAGTEAAWQLAEAGIHVVLWEMRPVKSTPAHVTDKLAELVCSNSLGSDLPDRAGGMLKAELRRLNSLVMRAADESRVPAGGALAVGRERFGELVTGAINNHPRIELRREEATAIPGEPTIIATGPLTSNAMADEIGALIGEEYLYFYDALSPIVTHESINFDIAFRASRYDRGEEEAGDYINCPMNKEEYDAFVHELIRAERIELRDFEKNDKNFFEGCLPIEVMAGRGEKALAFGPLRPVGITDPRTGRWPYAVVQLRQDDVAGELYNIVGFQTNIKWPEQRRILRMIPGLENAEFIRLGQMHRNTFLNSPVLLLPTMQYRGRPDLFFAGQITGIEGYVGNAASGLVAGLNLARYVHGQEMLVFPEATMIGALSAYVCKSEARHFQPMKANFGIIPALPEKVRNKRERYAQYVDRGRKTLEDYLSRTELV